jgi:hypothetical protein
VYSPLYLVRPTDRFNVGETLPVFLDLREPLLLKTKLADSAKYCCSVHSREVKHPLARDILSFMVQRSVETISKLIVGINDHG